jgi:hypothetical protein
MSVRLPTGEPNGPMGMVGATLRLLNDEIKGPVQQVVLGSGYGSVDDVRRILTLPGVPTALEIGWPGEKKQILPLSNGGLDMEISRIQPWKPSP